MNPKVTVITITYNLIKAGREKTFKQCLESVHKQTYKNIEHIIIDGASNDGSLELIKKYADKEWITYYSEPDTGIYNAMNKGLSKATGEYIVFLNSDDFFHGKKGIAETVKTFINTNADYTYSKARYVNIKGSYYGNLVNVPESFFIRMPICHQSLFVKTDLMKKLGGFDENFKNAGDYEFILRLILSKAIGKETLYEFVSYRTGGFSEVEQTESCNECISAFEKNYSCYLEGQNFDFKKIFYDTIFPKSIFSQIINDVEPDLAKSMLKSWNTCSDIDNDFKQIKKIPYVKKKSFFLKNILGLRKEITEKEIKYYFLGLPIVKEKKYANKIKFSIFGIPLWKVKFAGDLTKIYFCGICILKYKKEVIQIKNPDDVKDKFHYDFEKSNIMIKSYKLYNSNLDNRGEKVAVFGVLPPEQTGIAPYTYKTHSILPKEYDIFSNIATLEDYDNLLQNGNVKNIYDLHFFEYANELENYTGKIFVLGNSEHHKDILWKAIKTKGEPNRFLYLHEASLLGVLPHVLRKNVVDIVKEWYPDAYDEILVCDNNRAEKCREKNIFCVKPVIQLTGIKNIIVNNELAKNLIKKEFTEEEYKQLNIQVLFHPVENINIRENSIKNNTDKIIIGTFGIPHDFKLSGEIIKAVKTLNEKNNNKYKLIIAGYNAVEYLACKSLYYDFIEVYDAPSADKLYELMNSVDLAIQLRLNPHGESSGCVTQLLALGKNIMTSTNFISSEFAQYCHTIDKTNSPEELAKKIEYAINNPISYDKNNLIEKYSFEKLGKLLYENIKNNDTNKLNERVII